jgi:hypothetical protein
MEKRLEDLINQADKLLDAACEERKNVNDQRISTEVESPEADRFNQLHVDRCAPFYRRCPRVAGFLTVIALFSVGAIVYMNVTAPPAIGRYQIVNGSVKATRFTSKRTSYGGHAEVADVVLPDGQIITARVDSGEEIPMGTTVPVRVYEDGAIRLDHPL